MTNKKTPSPWLLIKQPDGRTNLDICISTLEYRISGSQAPKIADRRDFMKIHKVKNLLREIEDLKRLKIIQQNLNK